MTKISQPARDAAPSEWTVYADALQDAGDPRGELIALNMAVATGMSPADRDAYVDRHRDVLLGSAAPHASKYQIGWHYGLADQIRVRIEPADDATAILGGLLGSPVVAGVRALALVGAPVGGKAVDLASAVDLLRERMPPSVRSLAFVDERATETTLLSSRDFDPPDLVRFGRPAAVCALAQLEELSFDVADAHQLALTAIEAPALRGFALRCWRLAANQDSCDVARALRDAAWPALRSLELRLVEERISNLIDDSDAYVSQYASNADWVDRLEESEDGEIYEPADFAWWAPMFEHLRDAPLERLALTGFESPATLLATLQRVGLPKTLRTLDFSDSSIASVEWFLANAAMLRTLDNIVLERTRISAADAAQLAKLGPNIIHSESSEPTYRYVLCSE